MSSILSLTALATPCGVVTSPMLQQGKKEQHGQLDAQLDDQEKSIHDQQQESKQPHALLEAVEQRRGQQCEQHELHLLHQHDKQIEPLEGTRYGQQTELQEEQGMDASAKQPVANLQSHGSQPPSPCTKLGGSKLPSRNPHRTNGATSLEESHRAILSGAAIADVGATVSPPHSGYSHSPPMSSCPRTPPTDARMPTHHVSAPTTEVISSLISSISAISSPEYPTTHDNPHSAAQEGSFGVTYGSYHHHHPHDHYEHYDHPAIISHQSASPTSWQSCRHHNHHKPQQQNHHKHPIHHNQGISRQRESSLSLSDLSSPSPVVRTTKLRPQSSISGLSQSSHCSSSNGLRSLFRSSSRPHSRNSTTDEAAPFGFISVEHSPTNTRNLTRRLSADAADRSHRFKGLLYMPSRERLRERENERRINYGHRDLRTDITLAETSISEEEPGELSLPLQATSPKPSMSIANPVVPVIPDRDSSLRKTSLQFSPRRSGFRSSKSSVTLAALPMLPPPPPPSSPPPPPLPPNPLPRRSSSHVPTASPSPSCKTSFNSTKTAMEQPLARSSVTQPALPVDWPASPSSTTRQLFDGTYFDDGRPEIDKGQGGGAPAPAVAPGRRRGSNLITGMSGPPALDGALRRKTTATSTVSEVSSKYSGRRSSDRPVQAAGFERRGSVDSIDYDISSYLYSPRLSQKIRQPQTGRVITFSEVGDRSGAAVFCCVGMGLTRYITAFYDELATTLKLRLITIDRPGVGGSEPYADPNTTPLAWPDDIYVVCQALRICKFSLIAHSAGAIYALATALRMPQHVTGPIHLLAPWIPPSQMSVWGTSQALPPTHFLPTTQRILRALPTPILKAANSSFMSAASSSIIAAIPKTPRRSRKTRHQKQPSVTINAASSSTNTLSSHAAVSTRGSLETSAIDQSRSCSSTPSGRDRPRAQSRAHTFSLDLRIRSSPAGLPPSPTLTCSTPLMSPASPDSSISGRVADTNSTAAASSTATPATLVPETLSDGEEDGDSEAVMVAAMAAEKARQQQHDSRLTAAIWGLATSGANPTVDLLVCLERRQTIGFRYVDITRPVIIHHGSRDGRVPLDNVQWLARMMPRCELRVIDGEGHGLMANATVMADVLDEVACAAEADQRRPKPEKY